MATSQKPYPKKVAVLTSGGLAPSLSTAVASLIEIYSRLSPSTDIICYLNGYIGLLQGDSLHVTPEIRVQASKLHQLGGSPIGNSRLKLTNKTDCVKRGLVNEGDDPQYVACQQLIRDQIEVLYTVGGDDTNLTAGRLIDFMIENFQNYKLCVIGLPKTIDCDVYPIAITLGATTAADQAAQFFGNVVAEHSASPRMLIIHEVMGRHCGQLTASAARAYRQRKNQFCMPELSIDKCTDIHAVYLPELSIDLEGEATRLKKIIDEIGCVNVFLSEGAGIEAIVAEMESKGEKVERDPFGHIRLDLIKPGEQLSKHLAKALKAEKVLVQKSGYFCRAAPANQFDRNLVRCCVEVGIESSRNGVSGVVGHDEERNNQLSVIDFHRIKGGKHFNLNVDWFVSMMKDIGQCVKPSASLKMELPSEVSKEFVPVMTTSKDTVPLRPNLVSVGTALITTSNAEGTCLEEILSLKSDRSLSGVEIQDLRVIIETLMTGCKSISKDCKNSGINSLAEIESKAQYKSLNLLAHSLLVNLLSNCGKISSIASHESEKHILVNEDNLENDLNQKYCCVLDPIDGCSNINANISVGTIWGIYKKGLSDDKLSENSNDLNLLQKGSKLLASGYCLYGAATVFMMTAGNGVYGFTLDVSQGSFTLTHRNISIPDDGMYYSVNEGYWLDWDVTTQNYVQLCQKNKKSLRYIGSMVADVHRTLLYGGVFMYPGTKKNPDGKLRLVYEVNPIAFLFEQAGGKAITTFPKSQQLENEDLQPGQRVLDLSPTSHFKHRVPVIMGSPKMVDQFRMLLESEDSE